MRLLFNQLFLWSWLLTVPLTVTGGYWAYRTIDRFTTFAVRYDPGVFSARFQLRNVGTYEYQSIKQRLLSAIWRMTDSTPPSFSSIHLFVPESSLSMLESHMPQSGFDYVKGRMLIGGKLTKVELKYRGDSHYRWAWDKKSMRIKTSKDKLYEGMRSMN